MRQYTPKRNLGTPEAPEAIQPDIASHSATAVQLRGLSYDEQMSKLSPNEAQGDGQMKRGGGSSALQPKDGNGRTRPRHDRIKEIDALGLTQVKVRCTRKTWEKLSPEEQAGVIAFLIQKEAICVASKSLRRSKVTIRRGASLECVDEKVIQNQNDEVAANVALLNQGTSPGNGAVIGVVEGAVVVGETPDQIVTMVPYSMVVGKTEPIVTKTPHTNESLGNVGSTYASADFEVQKLNDLEQIEEMLARAATQFAAIRAADPEATFVIHIEGSESKVTNPDNFKKIFSLAEARVATGLAMCRKTFGTDGITYTNTVRKDRGPEWPNYDVRQKKNITKDDSKYTDFQFTTIDIQASWVETSTVDGEPIYETGLREEVETPEPERTQSGRLITFKVKDTERPTPCEKSYERTTRISNRANKQRKRVNNRYDDQDQRKKDRAEKQKNRVDTRASEKKRKQKERFESRLDRSQSKQDRKTRRLEEDCDDLVTVEKHENENTGRTRPRHDRIEAIDALGLKQVKVKCKPKTWAKLSAEEQAGVIAFLISKDAECVASTSIRRSKITIKPGSSLECIDEKVVGQLEQTAQDNVGQLSQGHALTNGSVIGVVPGSTLISETPGTRTVLVPYTLVTTVKVEPVTQPVEVHKELFKDQSKFESADYTQGDALREKQIDEMLNSARQEIEDALKKDPNATFNIDIEGCESQVTNPDTFKAIGSLAQARVDGAKKKCDAFFAGLNVMASNRDYNLNPLKEKSDHGPVWPMEGKTKDSDCYKDFQYVKLQITVSYTDQETIPGYTYEEESDVFKGEIEPTVEREYEHDAELIEFGMKDRVRDRTGRDKTKRTPCDKIDGVVERGESKRDRLRARYDAKQDRIDKRTAKKKSKIDRKSSKRSGGRDTKLTKIGNREQKRIARVTRDCD
jgi:hypothetical protein